MTITLTMPDAASLVLGIAVAALVGVAVTVALVRLYGLRSLAKFAPHDFVVTVALGSVLAATAARSVSLPAGALALVGLFAVQGVVSRVRESGGRALVDNEPLLLVAGTQVLWENMDRAHVTADDLRAKLREANVLDRDEVHAVVLEGTGDISVLHGDRERGGLDASLLVGVVGADDTGGRPGSPADVRGSWLERDA